MVFWSVASNPFSYSLGVTLIYFRSNLFFTFDLVLFCPERVITIIKGVYRD